MTLKQLTISNQQQNTVNSTENVTQGISTFNFKAHANGTNTFHTQSTANRATQGNFN